MALVLVMAGVGLLLLPGLTRGLGRRLPPPQWARLCSAALVGGTVAVELGAVLRASPTVLRAAGVPMLAAACERVVGPMLVGGPVVGWVAAVVAAALPILAFAGLRRARRRCRQAWVEPSLGSHHRHGHFDLVLLPTDEVLAFSVEGSPSQVVLSEGLVATLDADQLEAVVRHEVAHLDHRHQRTLLLASALERAFAVVPPVKRSTAALRASLERWADEVAASEGETARSALRHALLHVSRVLAAPAVAAFSSADSVGERLDALTRPPALLSGRGRLVLYAPGVALGMAAALGVGSWTGEAWMVIAAAGRCLA